MTVKAPFRPAHQPPPQVDARAPDTTLSRDTVDDRPTVTRPWHTGKRTLAYIPGLDGIRAIAVTAVLLFHAGLAWLPGGFLGVDVFFVLSGFLITSILLKERERTGRIAFGKFYLGRARRLLPALLLVLATTAVLAVIFARDAASQVKTDIVASFFYVSNWWYVFHDQSYFEAIGRPPMLQHLWSLAVEEQFYLIWPIVLLLAYAWRKRTGVRKVAFYGAIASTVLMAVMAVVLGMPGSADPSRLYFGTDTHAMSILLGAALATVWRPDRLPRKLPAQGPLALLGIGLASLLGLVWFFHVLTEDSTFLYIGGFLIVSGFAAVLIAAASHPASPLGRLLGVQPLRWIGTRSYGLYLWHWPIFMITRPGIDIGLTGLPALTLRLALTAIAAELSFRFVEMPIRRGALLRIWRSWRAISPGYAFKRLAYVLLPATLVGALVIGALVSIPAPNANDYLGGQTEMGAGDLSANQQSQSSGTSTSGASESQTDPAPALADSNDTGVVDAPAAALASAGAYATTPITAIGDSVLLGASSTLKQHLKKLTVDASVSRQTAEVVTRIQARKAAGQLSDVVIVHTGTNGPPTTKQIDQILSALSDRKKVVLVNTHMPDKFMGQANTAIAEVAPKYKNVVLADWASAAEGHREYFVVDGTHTTPTGSEAFRAVIEQALKQQT